MSDISSVRVDRVASAFNTALRDYERIAAESLERERLILRRATNDLEPMQAQSSGGQQFQATQFRGVDLASQSEIDAEIIREQNEAVQQMEQDLADLAGCFVDVAEAVEEQGEMLDNVQENVAETRQEVEAGVQNQRKALEYKQGARWKIVLAVIIVLLIIGGVVVGVVCGTGNCGNAPSGNNSTNSTA
jgi:t-SNARE complex subunit (syntaxin)